MHQEMFRNQTCTYRSTSTSSSFSLHVMQRYSFSCGLFCGEYRPIDAYNNTANIIHTPALKVNG